jgi:hypothetical protein
MTDISEILIAEAAFTVAGGAQRARVKVSPHTNWGLQWRSTDTGEATHAVYISMSPYDQIKDLDETDPRWTLHSGISFGSEPAGVAGSAFYSYDSGHGFSGIMVVMTPTVDLAGYELAFTGTGRR